MDKRKIWLIIILMSTAVISLAIIQFYRIKLSVDLDEKNFNDQVIMALNNVQERVHEDARKSEQALEFFKNKNKTQSPFNKQSEFSSILSQYDDNWTKQRISYEINSNLVLFNPTEALEGIKPQKLKKFISEEFDDHGIDLDYDFGVFSFARNNFIQINGNYSALFDQKPRVNEMGSIDKSLYNSPYQINLFNTEVTKPGYLSVFFPNKTQWLWSSVWPTLLSSILFIGLILFCFIYTVNVVFRQKKISEMKTDFINNMTHEFKTPIATISLAADSITSPMISGEVEKVNRFAGIIKQENKRMLNQVEKVLQMALIDKKDFQLKLSSVNVHDTIRQAVEHTDLKVQKRNGSINMHLDAKNEIIEADQTHISNIIHNLLDNANKYSPDEPEIDIYTKNVENGVEIEIRDKGIGMSKDALKHVFEKFFRVHTGNVHDVKGFGLGLSYVKAMVDAHRGQIDVKSELGEGSSFILFFSHKLSD